MKRIFDWIERMRAHKHAGIDNLERLAKDVSADTQALKAKVEEKDRTISILTSASIHKGKECNRLKADLAAAKEIIELGMDEKVKVGKLRQTLESIIIRCEEGSKETDWLPIIANIAHEGLKATQSK